MPDAVSIRSVTQLPSLPPRPEDAHKGTFGRVLIVGGSRGMSGAVCLAGLGALRGGAGLVFLAVPAGIVPIVAAVEPSYLTLPLPEDNHGRLSIEAQLPLVEEVARHTAVALGPGLGQSDELQKLVRWLYTSVERPVVVDADGLNALAAMRDVLAHPTGGNRGAVVSPAARVLTPHPGEFARLLGAPLPIAPQDREETAVRFARDRGVVLVLKGHRSLITDGEHLAVNNTGNSGMATGGTGDVLTGLIAALLAQGMAPFEAAQLAVHLHGLAGDLAAADLSQPGLIASDLPHYLPRAWRALSASEST